MTAAPTLVTAIFELGHSSLAPPFHRDPDHYRRHLPAVLSIDLPMVIYTDAAHEALVRSLRGNRPTQLQFVNSGQLTEHAMYQPAQRIRQDPA